MFVSNQPFIACTMHGRVDSPVLKSKLRFHRPDREGAAQVVLAATFVGTGIRTLVSLENSHNVLYSKRRLMGLGEFDYSNQMIILLWLVVI